MTAVRVAIAQISVAVGDMPGNASKILEVSRTAAKQGAQVVLCPELSLCGYTPEDLLLRPSFVDQCNKALDRLRVDLAPLAGLHVIVGHPVLTADGLLNAATVLYEGKVVGTYYKQELPNYLVFDEKRYFKSDNRPFTFNVGDVCFGLIICEDAWFEAAPKAAAELGAKVLLDPNASPYSIGKQSQRIEAMKRSVARTGCALLYSNMYGAQDELVFEGASFAISSDGRVAAELAYFSEDLKCIDVQADGSIKPVDPEIKPASGRDCIEWQVWEALKLGLADYVEKNGFKSVILGLSGGIDSAVVLAIAVDALGADRVHAVMMPSRYTADISQIDSRDMVKRLGVQYDEVAIADLSSLFESTLKPLFRGRGHDTTEENIQARVRGLLLMSLSNKFGHLVMTTGNKSELSTGYCTLYGDMAGGYAVLKDVAKTLVYRLARWRNSISDVIPERIITRPPSAELRPDQTDQDNLPEYDVIDGIIEGYVERNQSPADLVAAGFDKAAVEQIVRLIRINEYKRRQSPPGTRITNRAFGRDWRYPLSNGFRESA